MIHSAMRTGRPPLKTSWRRAFCASAVAAVVLLTASCGSSATPTPSATPGPSASGSTFSSSVYAYSIALPAGWRPVPATEAWDGTTAVSSEDPWVDQFISSRGTIVWAYAAPTSKSLADLTDEAVAASASERQCMANPQVDEPLTVGEEAARFIVTRCPADSQTVIAWATVIHAGDGYFFYFIHPESLAPDPNAVDAFRALLNGIAFS
jgi:hypothetical protein